jgi:hypothetical protein
MVEVKVFRIKSKTPLLQHNPAGTMSKNDGMKTKKVPTPEQEAIAGMYKNGKGVIQKTEALRSSLIGGSKGRKKGMRGMPSILMGAVFTVEPTVPLMRHDGKTPIKTYDEITVDRAVVQRQGILRARPKFNEWQFDVALEIDTDFVTIEEVLTLLEIAGRTTGIGDWRPSKGGSYGRYTVELIS